MAKKFLLKHLGNMGDLVFFIPPVLATLKRRYPNCHITFVTAWGFKDRHEGWGQRNQDGFCLALLMTNPHIDQLVHWHDTKLSLAGTICREENRIFPTWNAAYFEQMKRSGHYDGAFELDFGLRADDNPIERMYAALGLREETDSHYQLYLTTQDEEVAAAVLKDYPHPRIFLLEGLAGSTTRNWDPAKTKVLDAAIRKRYGVSPLWFGRQHTPYWHGRPLTLRENIALLRLGAVGIGVLSGPLHFAAAVGLPTLTLYCDHPLHRAAPAYFLNRYIKDPRRRHRTLLGPARRPWQLLKPTTVSDILTPTEQTQQNFHDWTRPGRQATKSGLAVITVDEVLSVLHDMLNG